MSIRAQTPIPFLSEAEIPSPPLLVSSPLPIPPSPLPASPTHSLGYRAVMIQLRAELLSTSHLLPQPPPIILPPDVIEVTLPPQKRLCIAPYAKIRRDLDKESKDTNEIYGRLDDAQDDRLLMSGQLNLLQNDTNERTTRASPATITTTTPVTNAQLKALINQGVADALVAHDVDRSWNDNDSHNSGTGSRRKEHTAREFADKVNLQLANLHGADLNMVKSHVKTVVRCCSQQPWNTLMKMITAKYCPRDKIKKLEMEIRELKSDKIEKYVGGLPNMIHESVMASKSKTMQDAVEFAIELMDKKTHTFIKRQTENKNKFKDTSRNNQNQQQQNKRQNTGRAYTAGSGEKKPYGGSKPLSPTNDTAANNQRGTRAGQKANCFECRAQ
ncbi:hypothetical protein Tco_0937793 [Tanacetum coccineum]|uniref:Retrotransposon gag domain-containing protein n=1 Tax=Tanacetum coccineum TaxID=301880 RepID=A0ABQ5DG79_9ASTR